MKSKIFFTLPIILIGMLTACSGSGKPAENSSDADTVSADSVIGEVASASDNAQEDFETFYGKFATDKSFQAERIVFPLAISTDDNEMTIENENQFNEEWGSIVPTSDYPEATKIDKKVDGEKAHVEYRAPQLDYPSITLDFELREGRWMLTSQYESGH